MHKKIERNLRLLFWGKAFVGARLLTAIIVLFYIQRGLSISEVFYMSIVWSLTSLVLEVPSGYLADRIGRKKTLLLGVLLLLASQTLTLFAYGFWPFVAVFILMSASFACFSGTEEAMLYESLVQMGEQDKMNARNGKQISAATLPAIFMPAIGALLARDLLEPQFRFIILINLVIIFVGFLIFTRLSEPVRAKSIAEQEIGVFKQSIETIRKDPWLLKVALNKLLVFIAIFVAWRTSQPILQEYGLGVEGLALFYVLFQSLEFVFSWFAGRIEERIGTGRIIFWSPIVIAAALGVAAWSTQLWVVFAALVIAIGLQSLREPVFAHAVNQRISSHSRATTLSNMNVLKGLLDIPVLFLVGAVAGISISYPLIIATALCVVVVLFFSIGQSSLVIKKQAPSI